MADRIETLLEAERRLLLDVSHELRSPLARMSLAIELARSGGEDLPRHLDRIEKEAGKLNSLVGELLQVTRAEGDRSRMVLQPIAVEELVQQVVDESRIEANERPCQLTISTAEALQVEGDPDLLHRALENILRNAIRYTAPNSEVNLTITSERGEAVITIRDHGPGAPDGSLARLFDPFYRVEPDRDRASGGVGLGLAIARRAIQLHGGRVHAENADPGLRVIIHLPAATLRTT
jgi:two-component system sensor histidine kinase CpxA